MIITKSKLLKHPINIYTREFDQYEYIVNSYIDFWIKYIFNICLSLTL